MRDRARHPRRTATWLVALLLLPAALLAATPLDGALAQSLLLQRDAVLAGQGWRALTCHWVHVSASHFAWDALTFAALGVACARRDLRRFVATVALAAPAISATVLLTHPELSFYGGLSGIDSALFGLLAATMLQGALSRRDRTRTAIAAILTVAFVAKTGYELTTAGTLFVAETTTARAVPIAHVAGFAVGVLVSARRPARRRRPSGAAAAHPATPPA